MSKPIIERLSPDDIINDFHNNNLRDYIIARNDILIFSKYDPDERIGMREGPPLGNNNVPTTIDVKAKNALEEAKKKAENKLQVLVCLEQLREEMKSFKVDFTK